MSQVYLATRTMLAIDGMVKADQGAAYRGWLRQVLPHIGDAYRTDEEAHRSHMGASVIGGECPRAIWYNFRWVLAKKFEGRMMRLFNRGHLEEGRLIALLLMIGCKIYQQDEKGKQFRVSHAEGHFGGSGDGIALGVPDAPEGQPCLTEFKTYNEKQFAKLAGNNWDAYYDNLLDPSKPAAQFSGGGVKEAKFEHYVQMQIYMRKFAIGCALYVAVNKNTDHLYCEMVPLDVAVADEFLERGRRLVGMESPPTKINMSPAWWKCKFCDYKPVCHLGQAPERNCRTCEHSRPVADAQWFCGQHQANIPKEVQLTGCQSYKVKSCL